ncbi:conserved Plasmodium protein, unknown function [Plasmodium gallinaceum]|uniref:Uncharacterized protein n=1 Tax=Plasmodium gallinaceum TaxID=5849 RepID=A0A1J1H2H4_PLAGA|nr:conserved Plasmodium protein, unknown function [Plasmodium gallinaceum]CRG97534.1 conserved Plasmodium protein, unknown function [Plasmodium gallinaceum]
MILPITRVVFIKNKSNDKVVKKMKFMCKRNFGGVKFLDTNRTAEETVYFKKEDEALLRNLLKNNPNLNPNYDLTDVESGAENLSNDLSLVFSKYGIKGLNNNLMKDLIKVFELNGYRKMLDQ